MGRLDDIADMIDKALRDDASGGAVFDLLPAWAAEWEAVHGSAPGSCGGYALLDHYMMASDLSDCDEWAGDGEGNGIARIGRCLLEWDDRGFYSARLMPSVAAAREVFLQNDTDEG